MREITTHIVPGDSVNHQLKVAALAERGSGGANHHYEVSFGDQFDYDILFQKGPIKEAGNNGLTHEALLAILIDRLEGFQAGPYASEDNAIALEALRLALAALQKRTLERIARGVEGTSKA